MSTFSMMGMGTSPHLPDLRLVCFRDLKGEILMKQDYKKAVFYHLISVSENVYDEGFCIIGRNVPIGVTL